MGFSGRSERLRVKQLYGGYSIRDYVPPRINQNGVLELHAPLANFEGPRTDIRRRVREGVKPTTHTDAAARIHDIQYNNIGYKLGHGKMNRQQAYNAIKAADTKLLKSAAYNKLSINPVEHLHANAGIVGMIGKKALQSTGLMDELKFVGRPEEELVAGAGRRRTTKPRKRNLVKGLQKRFKEKK